jgi:hypothetical protein
MISWHWSGESLDYDALFAKSLSETSQWSWVVTSPAKVMVRMVLFLSR